MCWIDYCGTKDCPGYELVPDATLELADALAKAVEAWWFHVCAEPLVCEHVSPMADALAEYRKARGTAPEPILSDLGT